MSTLGNGSRFKALKSKLAQKGAKNPAALAAYIGDKKYGKKRMEGMADKGKKDAGEEDKGKTDEKDPNDED